MALYGAVVQQTNQNESDYRYDTLGKNSEVFAVGDLLTVTGTAGVLKVAGATDVIVGISAKAQTMSSTNQTVAKVYPAYIPISTDTIFLMGCNTALTGNATDGGTYYKITGTTGVQQVDTTSGVQTTTSRVVEIVKVDPNQAGDLTQAAVRIIKTPYTNVAATS